MVALYGQIQELEFKGLKPGEDHTPNVIEIPPWPTIALNSHSIELVETPPQSY